MTEQEAEARIDREIRAEAVDGRTPYQVALARLAKAEQERDEAMDRTETMIQTAGDLAKRATVAEARERELREALVKRRDEQVDPIGYAVCEEVLAIFDALQATREDGAGENPHYGPGNPDWGERDFAKGSE